MKACSMTTLVCCRVNNVFFPARWFFNANVLYIQLIDQGKLVATDILPLIPSGSMRRPLLESSLCCQRHENHDHDDDDDHDHDHDDDDR